MAKLVHVLSILSDVAFSLSVSVPPTHSPCLIMKSESGSAIHSPILLGVILIKHLANVSRNVAVFIKNGLKISLIISLYSVEYIYTIRLNFCSITTQFILTHNFLQIAKYERNIEIEDIHQIIDMTNTYDNKSIQ